MSTMFFFRIIINNKIMLRKYINWAFLFIMRVSIVVDVYFPWLILRTKTG